MIVIDLLDLGIVWAAAFVIVVIFLCWASTHAPFEDDSIRPRKYRGM